MAAHISLEIKTRPLGGESLMTLRSFEVIGLSSQWRTSSSLPINKGMGRLKQGQAKPENTANCE